jgi:hypothetical protein
MASMDFLVVPTVTFRLLYVLVRESWKTPISSEHTRESLPGQPGPVSYTSIFEARSHESA